MLEPAFLIPFIWLCLSFSWSVCAKTACERNHDFVLFYDSPLWSMVQFLTILSILVAIIIVIVKVSFLSALCYLGIAIGCIFLGQFTTSIILVGIFSYSGLGSVLPLLSCIGTAIWMFIKTGTLSC